MLVRDDLDIQKHATRGTHPVHGGGKTQDAGSARPRAPTHMLLGSLSHPHRGRHAMRPHKPTFWKLDCESPTLLLADSVSCWFSSALLLTSEVEIKLWVRD